MLFAWSACSWVKGSAFAGTVLKNGIEVILGILVTAPFAPFFVNEFIDLLNAV